MSENTVAQGGVEFKVYDDSKVVVCRLTGCSKLPMTRIEKYTDLREVGQTHGHYEIDDVFVGIARCSDEDEFDPEYGKKLALTRAKRKRGKAINAAVSKFIASEQKKLSTLETYGIHDIPEVEEIQKVINQQAS